MDDEIYQWLAEGIAKAKAGQREKARELLLRVVEHDECNVQAWLWLSGIVDNMQDRRVALENVLDIEPDNAAALAGLDWLNRQATSPPPSEPAPEPGAAPQEHPNTSPQDSISPPVDDELPLEQEGCPCCGQPVQESDQRCAHCAEPLTNHLPKVIHFPARVGLLVAIWVVQAIADLMDGALIVMALQAMSGAQGTVATAYFTTYLAGATFKPGQPASGLVQAVTFFVGFNVVASAWSLAVAAILPQRRPAAPVVALFVAVVHVALAGAGLVMGLSSIFIAGARAALALLIGFWLLESHGDFEWVNIRQRLELDRSARSSMDLYTQGRYYRKIGQTAKAILHFERAIELHSDRFDYRLALGNAYYALGRYDRAAEQLRAALQLNPDATEVRQFLDIVTERLSSSEPRMA
jgi:tetratricopeptide (TPR) repeat protein